MTRPLACTVVCKAQSGQPRPSGPALAKVNATPTARTFGYIRVSTDEQAETGRASRQPAPAWPGRRHCPAMACQARACDAG